MKVGVAMRAVTCAMLLAGVLAVAGCSPTSDGTAEPVSTSAAEHSIAEDVPSGFKPCTDIPQAILDSEGLHRNDSPSSRDESQRGKVKWRGCGWVVSDGYTATISATNLTLAMVRDKHFPGEREITVNGRPVLITHQAADPTGRENCVLNAQMQGGSLEFTIGNPSGTSPKTRHLNACDIGQTLAGKVVPLIPAGA